MLRHLIAAGVVGASSSATSAGDWRRSPACGARNYERAFLFMTDGTFVAEDRVALCPPNAKCAWSGVLTWKGRYRLSESRIDLEVDRTPVGSRPRVGVKLLVPLPASLERDRRTGALSERAPDGRSCPYSS